MTLCCVTQPPTHSYVLQKPKCGIISTKFNYSSFCTRFEIAFFPPEKSLELLLFFFDKPQYLYFSFFNLCLKIIYNLFRISYNAKKIMVNIVCLRYSYPKNLFSKSTNFINVWNSTIENMVSRVSTVWIENLKMWISLVFIYLKHILCISKTKSRVLRNA